MKVFNYRNHNIGKKYVTSASAYKMLTRKTGQTGLNFSPAALYENYYYGTHGKKAYKDLYGREEPDRKSNGYAYGEFLYDLTLAAISEDLKDGYLCKAEFIFDYGIPAKLRAAIKDMRVDYKLFAWEYKRGK